MNGAGKVLRGGVQDKRRGIMTDFDHEQSLCSLTKHSTVEKDQRCIKDDGLS